MCNADIGNDADIRAGNRREAAHLAEMVDAHLQDGYLMFLVHLKDCERKPPFVIEVADGLVYLIFLGDYRSDHLFGACLSYASGNSHNLDVKRIPVQLGNIKKRLSGGFHQDVREIRISQVFVGDDA